MATNNEHRQPADTAISGSQKRFPDLSSVLGIDTISALAIENSPFDVADIVDRDVSYVMLQEAGVSPLAADRLRRRYSLTWTFVWTEGAHLLQRAEQLRTLRETERAWIAASTTSAHRQEHRARRRWREIRETADDTRPLDTDRSSDADCDVDVDVSIGIGIDDDGDGDGDDVEPIDKGTCPRCGDGLQGYTLGRCETVTCESCGFARLNAAHIVESPPEETAATDEGLSWEESVRQFVADR